MKKWIFTIAAFILCLGLTACSNRANVTRENAEKTALGEIEGGVIDTYTERFDDDEPHHLFNIVRDGKYYEVKVHRHTGEVISNSLVDDTTIGSNDVTINGNTTNTVMEEAEAERIAIDKVGGGTVAEKKLITDSGRQKYKFEIRYNNKEYELEVDAITGEVLEFEEHVPD